MTTYYFFFFFGFNVKMTTTYYLLIIPPTNIYKFTYSVYPDCKKCVTVKKRKTSSRRVSCVYAMVHGCVN